jgi:hypothetical protein
MAFYNTSLTLHRLIAVTITRLYGQNLGNDALPSESEAITRITELEQRFKEWQDGLPTEFPLIWSTALPVVTSDWDRVIGRFRAMLTLRYYNLNILAHRPPLCRRLDEVAELSWVQMLPASLNDRSQQAIEVCVASAQESIDIVHGILVDPALGHAILGAWWFSLYYLFNAALVVFSESIIQPTTSPQHVAHLQKAIEAFRLLDRNNSIVDRCADYVQYLLKILERQIQSSLTRTSTESALASIDPMAPAMGERPGYDGLPDLNDFLKDDLQLAQFFASGIFDVHDDNLLGF